MKELLKVGDKYQGVAGEWTVTYAESYHTCLQNTEDKNLTLSFSSYDFPSEKWKGHIAWPYSYGGSFDRQPSACVYDTLEEALTNFNGEPKGDA